MSDSNVYDWSDDESWQDLLDAINRTVKNDLSRIGRETILEDGKATVLAPFQGIKSLGSLVYKGVQSARKPNRVIRLKQNVTSAGEWLKTKPTQTIRGSREATQIIKDYVYQHEDKQERAFAILKLATTFISFGGSLYFGYSAGKNLPDKDISHLGIGYHRNHVYHSYLVAIPIILLSKFFLRFFNQVSEHLSNYNEKQELLNFIKLNLGIFAVGTSFGVSAHLWIDGTSEGHKAVVSPGIGSFVSGTLLDDNLYLVLNSILAAFGAAEIAKEDVFNGQKENPNRKA